MRNPLTFSLRVVTAGVLLGATAVACGGDDDSTESVVHGMTVLDAGAADGRIRLGEAHVGDAATTTTKVDTSFSISLPGQSAQDVDLAIAVDTSTSVTAVAADGAYTVHETVNGLTIEEAPDGADLAELEAQYAALEGATFEHMFDASGVAGDSRLLDEESLPDEARGAADEIIDSVSTAAIMFPTEPVGVGAKWTASQTISKQGFDLTVTYDYELMALDGDRYEITVTYDDDIDQDVTSDGTTFDVTGAISGGGTATGSIANPLVQSVTVDQTLQLNLEADGDSADLDATYHVEVNGV